MSPSPRPFAYSSSGACTAGGEEAKMKKAFIEKACGTSEQGSFQFGWYFGDLGP